MPPSETEPQAGGNFRPQAALAGSSTGKRDRPPERIPLLGEARDSRGAQCCRVLAAQCWNHGLVRISSKHSWSVIPLSSTIHWSLCRRAQMFQESEPK